MSGTANDIWTTGTPHPPTPSGNNGGGVPPIAKTGTSGGVGGVGGELAMYRSNGTALARPGTPSTAEAPTEGLFTRAHRTLRGRYVKAITCGLLGAALGGVWGWFSSPVMYRAEGRVSYEPTVASISAQEQPLIYYNNFMNTRAKRLESPDLIQQMMSRPEWRDVGGREATPGAIRSFANGLAAFYKPGTEDIEVIYRDRTPELADAGLAAVLEVAELENRNTGTGRTETKLAKLTEQINSEKGRRSQLVGQRDELTTGFNTGDLGAVEGANREAAAKLRQAINDLDQQTAMAMKALDRVSQSPVTAVEIARSDELMRTYLAEKAALQNEVSRLADRYDVGHPQVQNRRRDLERLDRSIAEYAAGFQGAQIPFFDEDGEMQMRTVTRDTVQALEARKEILEEALANIRREQEGVVTASSQVRQIDADIDAIDLRLQSLERDRQQLLGQSNAIGQNFSKGRVEFATVDNDRRSKMAMVGAVGGFSVPFGIFLLMGLFDSRYRYSDDTTASQSGLTLLGILPNLPDRMSDPEQAGIAAHCVHQIRTMLQLQNGVEHAQAYAVTSATSGDGKTSLCLAMGLSFAAAGSKTLMIDSDLVGQGLSDRLGLAEAAQFGLMEALAEPHQIDRVTHPTDVDNLALLPIGNAEGAAAGSISPRQMIQLINEAKKRYDVVLIDTGPILGSIEATPVVASADGVVVTVSRGQNKTMVDKALGHLAAVGAKVCGVVFNRAQERDFEQSINGMSIKSVSRANPMAARSELPMATEAR